ncbi:MAG: flagellar hook basal-body protein [Candidatus Aureabacteria bacterium]|nr:flagellar hook basal-body protein [Candidatus Auribacterota bacterium]
MFSGLYASATGLVTRDIAMNHLTSNMVNSNVSGYKKEFVVFHSFDEEFKRELEKFAPGAETDFASGIDIIQGITDFSQGPLKYTGDPMDYAIEGDGFFTLETDFGKVYSRKGVFKINSLHELVTDEGYKVLLDSGSPVVFEGAEPGKLTGSLGILDDGTVYYLDAASKKVTVGKLDLVKFTNPEQLERLGYGLWKTTEENPGTVASDAKICQGYLEMANTSPVENMVEIMFNQRLFDANANALKTIQQSVSNLISAFGG